MKKVFRILFFCYLLLIVSCRKVEDTNELKDGTIQKTDTTDNILQRTSKKMDSEVENKLDKQIIKMSKDSIKNRKQE